MEIIKISPQGYCNGVKYALKKVKETIDNPDMKRPIYLLGNLIHNKNVMNEIKKQGVIVLEGKKRYDLLDEIESGTVIFSAHGVSPRVYEKAKNKNLTIVDATCPNVLIVHNQIMRYLNDGYEIIYIGTKSHPESEGVIEISSHVHLISSEKEIDELSINTDKIFITNQTTLSIFDIVHIYDLLKAKYNKAIIDNKICLATTKRQEALLDQKGAKLCVVVGDKTSSNSQKLVSVSQNKANVISYLVETKADLDASWFRGVNKVSVTSGASTPENVTNEVIEAIKRMT